EKSSGKEKEKRGEKYSLLLNAEETEWLLSIADLVYEEEKEEKLEHKEETSEPTGEHYEWMRELNQKFERTLTLSGHDAVEESWLSAGEAWWDLDDDKNDYDQEPPSREPLMSPLHKAIREMNRKLDIEEFEEKLRKREPVLEFLLETETAELESGTPEEKMECWIDDANENLTKEKEEGMEVFMVLVNDEDDDKTVQDE
ncbi:21390_t:CDS:2, partial [Gigaspora rosea]